MRACAETVLVSQLVSHGEGHRETRVLADAAAAMGLTHARHVGQSQRLAGDVDGCTDVLPGKKQASVGHTSTGKDRTHLQLSPWQTRLL